MIYVYTYIYTYTIGHYNPSFRITILLLPPLMFCVLISYISGGANTYKSTQNYRLFKKLYLEIYCALRVFARNLLGRSHRRNIFDILIFNVEHGVWTAAFTSNKPKHYLLHHSDFMIIIGKCIQALKVFLLLVKMFIQGLPFIFRD